MQLLVKLVLLMSVVTASSHATEVSVHDPVMAKEGDTYYVYSTGPGITFYSSQNMLDWKSEGRIFKEKPTWAQAAAPDFNGHVWAPDVQFHQGKYYLYYSVSGFGKNASAIGVATNTTLNPHASNYHWQDHGLVIKSIPGRDDWNAIDPNIAEDNQGQGWMVFGSFWGGIKLVKLNDDWTQVKEPQEWHTVARRAVTISAHEGTAGPQEIEAPFIFKKNNYYYLFVSWGLCCQGPKSTYRLMIGRSNSITGPYLDKEGHDLASGGGSLVIGGTSEWKALGHNSAYSMDGKDYLVLHAYETADNYLQKLKIMEMHWDSALWPVVDVEDLNKYKSRLLPE